MLVGTRPDIGTPSTFDPALVLGGSAFSTWSRKVGYFPTDALTSLLHSTLQRSNARVNLFRPFGRFIRPYGRL